MNMKNCGKKMIGGLVIGFALALSGCNETPAPSKASVSHHGDEQMWQQFQSKQATDQLDKDFSK